MAWVRCWVYKSSCLDVLESFFLLLTSCCHVLCQTLESKSTCSLVHLCHHRTWDNHSNSHLSHLPATKVHNTLEERELANQELFVKLKPPTPKAEHDLINDPTESVNLDHLHEPWLENLIQPTHNIASDLYTPACVCIPKNSLFSLCNVSYSIYLPLK